MLECVPIILYVIIVVVRIGEKLVPLCKHVVGAHVRLRQMHTSGILYHEEVFSIESQVSAYIVAKVGVGIALANNLHGFVYTNRTMVCSNHYAVVALGQRFEDVVYHRVAEPAHGDASVGLFVFRQFPYGFRLCSCVAKYVDEVKHHDIEVFVLYFVKLRHKLFR